MARRRGGAESGPAGRDRGALTPDEADAMTGQLEARDGGDDPHKHDSGPLDRLSLTPAGATSATEP